jgi:hypothetical protein
MQTAHLIVVIGNHFENLPFQANYLNRIGVTSEPVDSRGIIWCAFEWGYGAYRREEVLFLGPIKIDCFDIKSIAKLRDANLPRILIDKSVIASWHS